MEPIAIQKRNMKSGLYFLYFLLILLYMSICIISILLCENVYQSYPAFFSQYLAIVIVFGIILLSLCIVSIYSFLNVFDENGKTKNLKAMLVLGILLTIVFGIVFYELPMISGIQNDYNFTSICYSIFGLIISILVLIIIIFFIQYFFFSLLIFPNNNIITRENSSSSVSTQFGKKRKKLSKRYI